MAIIVTGATGYVGASIARGLAAAGEEIHVLARPTSSLELLRGTVPADQIHYNPGSAAALAGLFCTISPDVVVHLAALFRAQHRVDEIEALVEANLTFGTQVAEAAARSGCRLFLNTGTSWQHYRSIFEPVCLYAAMKSAFEDVLAYYVSAEGMSVATLLIYDSYGPGDPRPKLLSLLCRHLLNGERLDVSPGEQAMELVHIDDIVKGFVTAVGHLRSGRIVGQTQWALRSGEPRTVREVVSALEGISGRELSVVWGGRPYRDREVMEPWRDTPPLPGWQPEIDLEEGLRQLISGQREGALARCTK